MQVSVIIPVYNGEKTIGQLNKLLKKELEGSFSYNIIMVCDPCSDKTFEIVKSMAAGDPEHTRAVFNEERIGQHRSILKGIGESSGELIVTMDDDLQHDPVYIKEFVKWQKEADFDVVYAVFSNPAHSRLRNYASNLFRKLLILTIPGICPYYSAYRIMKRETALKITRINKPYIFIDGLLAACTTEFAGIKAEHRPRGGGRSAYGLFRLMKHAVGIMRWYAVIGNR